MSLCFGSSFGDLILEGREMRACKQNGSEKRSLKGMYAEERRTQSVPTRVFLSFSLRAQELQDGRAADLRYQEKQLELNASQISQGVFPLFNSF